MWLFASMPADRALASQRVGKEPKPIPASLWDIPARKHGKALSRMASRQNRVRDQASHSRKQQTARPHSVHWWFSHQRPVRVGLQYQARCDYHPWRQCSLYGLNLQVDIMEVKAGGSSHPCPPLDYLKRWQLDRTCHHPHRFNELAAKNEKWNGKPRLECVSGRQPPSNTPVGVLPWTCRSEGKRPNRETGGQSNPYKWRASRKLWSAEELETLPSGTKPKTSHH